MKKISIKEMFKNDSISRAAGEKLRNCILNADSQNEQLCLDFTGVIVASTSFFDEGIAKLVLEGWDDQRLAKSVRFEGMVPRDREVMKKVCHFRKLMIA